MADNILNVKAKQELEPKAEPTSDRPVFTPPVDIYEEKDALVLLADLPGVGESDLDIHLEENTITIRAKVSDTLKDKEPLVTEYRVGDYYRKFTVSNMVDQDKISAHLKDGVLRIVLPKAEVKKPRKVPVTAG
jgi:HSP20 family protein